MSKIIQFRVDEELKEQSETLFNAMGLDVPSALRMFLKQSVIHQGIPFDISLPSVPNSETVKALEDIEAGRNLSKPHSNIDDFMRDINA